MNRFVEIRDELRQLLGPDIGIGVTDPKCPGGVLLPEEESAVERAVTKRQLEFTSGRAAARLAMRDLGCPPVALPMAADRSPVWPDGLVGSITHSDDICIAVVANSSSRQSIGIDLEPNTPLESGLECTICTPSERSWLSTQPPERRGYLAKEIFCVKESIYKALFPLTRRVMEFGEVEVVLPLHQCSYFTLKTTDQPQELAINLKSLKVADNIFVYVQLFGTESMTKRSGSLAS